jgi:YfiR/HmsC-like
MKAKPSIVTACLSGRLPAWLAGLGQWRRVMSLALLAVLMLASSPGVCGDAPSLTEYQVKALFLLNFTKYVEWPDAAFEQADAPITIGVVGENHFGEDLKKAVEGKSVNGRKIIIVSLETESDWSKCRILFISGSEKKRLAEILGKIGTLPVLTVGETEQFTQQGGMVNFTRKDGKVRLEINLTAAEKAKVGISSKLLSVADVVRGKP